MHDRARIWFPFEERVKTGAVRLFCLPYAGAGASLYASWIRRAPSGVAVVPVQLPGRESRVREAPVVDVLALVDRLARHVEPLTTEPYALFGHSMGALVALELARRLRASGCAAPVALFASGRAAPDEPPTSRPLHRLADRDFLDEIRRLAGTPSALLDHPEFAAVFLPVLRADFTAVETYAYAPQAPLSSPISVFGGKDDTIAPAALDGWRRQTSCTFCVRMLAGGHFFLQPNQDVILDAIAGDLAPVR